MTSYCDVTNSVYPVTMTTIRHCSILEFGRGASNQAVAPGITRPLHAIEWWRDYRLEFPTLSYCVYVAHINCGFFDCDRRQIVGKFGHNSLCGQGAWSHSLWLLLFFRKSDWSSYTGSRFIINLHSDSCLHSEILKPRSRIIRCSHLNQVSFNSFTGVL